MLDSHFGTIAAWREAIDEIHRRGMYVVLENTMSTMGDLLGFDGFLNTTTPFSFTEHKAIWKSSRQYWDFHIGDEIVEDCKYPRFWDEHGERVGSDIISQMKTCRDSDFDQVSFSQHTHRSELTSPSTGMSSRLGSTQSGKNNFPNSASSRIVSANGNRACLTRSNSSPVSQLPP